MSVQEAGALSGEGFGQGPLLGRQRRRQQQFSHSQDAVHGVRISWAHTVARSGIRLIGRPSRFLGLTQFRRSLRYLHALEDCVNDWQPLRLSGKQCVVVSTRTTPSVSSSPSAGAPWRLSRRARATSSHGLLLLRRWCRGLQRVLQCSGRVAKQCRHASDAQLADENRRTAISRAENMSN